MNNTIFTHQTASRRQSCGNVVRLTLTDRELFDSAEVTRGVYYAHPCTKCGGMLRGQVVQGKNSGKVKSCNVKCESATGPNCDCPCSGENHGRRHAA